MDTQEPEGVPVAGQRVAESWLNAGAEWNRTLASVVSEAVWCFELASPFAADGSEQEEAMRLCRESVLVEFNPAFIALLGSPAEALWAHTDGLRLWEPPAGWTALMKGFIDAGFRLENKLVPWGRDDAERGLYLVNMTGVLEEGRLVRYWGSAEEVTDAHELKAHMMALLESQLQRIGRDLHDGLGQLLTGLRMLSEQLADRLAQANDPLAGRADRLAVMAREAAMHIRHVCQGLAPASLSDRGLQAALQALARRVNNYDGVLCTFESDGVDVTDVRRSVHLYRIAQEAVNNAVRHGRPRHIAISLIRREGGVVLEVEDDGEGFAFGGQSTEGMGLSSMRHRATILGARFDVASAPGRGTTITCRLPLR